MKEKYFSYIRLQMILCMILFCGWWGFLYPQLVLPEGTYKITYAKENTDEENVVFTGEDLLKELESNKENTICIKSKLLTMLQEFLWENDDE